jgi:type VI protein secretion system component VasK
VKPQRVRAVVISAVAVVFLGLFLSCADGLPWRPLLLAAGGLAVVVALTLLGIRLQERSDAKAAAANIARCRAAEADDQQHQLWKARLG